MGEHSLGRFLIGEFLQWVRIVMIQKGASTTGLMRYVLMGLDGKQICILALGDGVWVWMMLI
jgi:hypothetical protein